MSINIDERMKKQTALLMDLTTGNDCSVHT